MIRICRVFTGGYPPDYEKLQAKEYIVLKFPAHILTVLTGDQGFGQIKGHVKRMGINYPSVNICVFKKDNRQLLWETRSKPDGTYAFRNIAMGLECFVIAFDPNNHYNAVIQDKVVAK